MLEDFVDKLVKLEDDVVKMGFVFFQYDVVCDQSEEIEYVIVDIKQFELVFEKVFKIGDEILEIFELGEEKDEFKEKLSDFCIWWNVVKMKIEDCKFKIDDVLVVVKIYYYLL